MDNALHHFYKLKYVCIGAGQPKTTPEQAKNYLLPQDLNMDGKQQKKPYTCECSDVWKGKKFGWMKIYYENCSYVSSLCQVCSANWLEKIGLFQTVYVVQLFVSSFNHYHWIGKQCCSLNYTFK